MGGRGGGANIKWNGPISHFTVVSSVTCTMNASDTGGDLASIQTSPPFSFKSKLVSIRTT